jgi:aerobic-type carbon monoxide dehydrogenase small subunit (CoxS/CutS family)
MTAKFLLERSPAPTEAEVRAELAGNLCRCTGYAPIVDSILAAAEKLRR